MLMRRLHPDPAERVDTLAAYALPETTGPYLRANMVTSLDGAAAVEGRVGLLSGTADQVLLHELRALCDVLLVGAGTLRAERYGPVRVSEEHREHRRRQGRLPSPRLAVLSRGLSVDLSGPAFTGASAPPLLLTTGQAPAQRRAAAAEVAEVVVIGDGEVELGAALGALAERGLPQVLSEGGPHVLAELFAADLVDELCLAVAPVVTCGDDLGITAGPGLRPPSHLRLAHVLEEEQTLFLRYTR